MKTPARRKKKAGASLRTTVFCGVSLDGFLARPDDGLDFLETGQNLPLGFEEFFRSVDVVVIGRRTFEVVLRLGHFGLYGKKRVVILSSRRLDLSSVKGSRVEQMSGTPQKIVSRLKASGARHAYIDGGITIQRFLGAGLIDRLVITRLPVLIGQGVPLFGALERDVHLRHVATRPCAGGMVQSEYRVVKDR